MIPVYAGKRGNGKAIRMLEWVIDGERTEGYPGWTRILIVPTFERLKAIKDDFKAMAAAKAEADDVPTPEWGDLDFSHRVFAAEEWARVVNVREETEIAVDGLDELPIPTAHLVGKLSRYTLNGEAEPRDPENGMSISEANEHAAAHDGRYRRIRDAVKRVAQEHEAADERGQAEALTELFMIAADYDWAHPGDEILGLPEEDSTGVAGYGEPMTKDEFIEQLGWLVEHLHREDSMEGSLAYEMTPDGFIVQGAIRYGNSMGQGAVRLYRKGLERVD